MLCNKSTHTYICTLANIFRFIKGKYNEAIQVFPSNTLINAFPGFVPGFASFRDSRESPIAFPSGAIAGGRITHMAIYFPKARLAQVCRSRSSRRPAKTCGCNAAAAAVAVAAAWENVSIIRRRHAQISQP